MEENKSDITVEYKYYPFILWKMGRRHIKYIAEKTELKVTKSPTKKDGVISITVCGSDSNITKLKKRVRRADFNRYIRYLENNDEYLLNKVTRNPKEDIINYIIEHNKFLAFRNIRKIHKIEITNKHLAHAIIHNSYCLDMTDYDSIFLPIMKKYIETLDFKNISEYELCKYINNCVLNNITPSKDMVIPEGFKYYLIDENEFVVVGYLFNKKLMLFSEMDTQMTIWAKSHKTAKMLRKAGIGYDQYLRSDSSPNDSGFSANEK